MDCIFCKIANGEIPADIVMQDEHFAAFRDINPQAPTHLLIVPKMHTNSIAKLETKDSEMLGRMIDFARHLADKQGLSNNGFRLIFNSGKDAGMEVDHLHLHLLGGAPLGAITGWQPQANN